MRVTDPSGAVRGELRLSAEGASREAALRYVCSIEHIFLQRFAALSAIAWNAETCFLPTGAGSITLVKLRQCVQVWTILSPEVAVQRT